MGRPKYIYFREEILQKLEGEPNMSALINDLLLKHFDENDLGLMSLEELKAEQEVIEIEKEAKKRIKEVRNGKRDNH